MDGKEWVGCDKCEKWNHTFHETLDMNAEYFCLKCRKSKWPKRHWSIIHKNPQQQLIDQLRFLILGLLNRSSWKRYFSPLSQRMLYWRLWRNTQPSRNSHNLIWLREFRLDCTYALNFIITWLCLTKMTESTGKSQSCFHCEPKTAKFELTGWNVFVYTLSCWFFLDVGCLFSFIH